MGFLENNDIKAVAFDIDGTFYPLKETHKRVLRASLFHLPFALRYNRARQSLRTEDSFRELPILSRRENAERMCMQMYGHSDSATVERFLEKEKRVFTERYERLFRDIKPYDGVENVLSLLKEKNYPMAVLSDFPVGSKLESMGLSSYFPIQISTEEIGRSKPSLTPFMLLSRELGVGCGNILYVGDSLYKDSEGAKRSGMKSVLITDERSVTGPDLVVSDWLELKDKLF